MKGVVVYRASQHASPMFMDTATPRHINCSNILLLLHYNICSTSTFAIGKSFGP